MLQVTKFIYIIWKGFLKIILQVYTKPNNRPNITKIPQMIRYIRILLNIAFSLYNTETFGRKFFPKY